MSGVDEPVCGVSSVMTAGALDVCGCGSLVSDETGDHYPCLCCWKIVACSERDMAYMALS